MEVKGSGLAGYKRGPKKKGPKDITEEQINEAIEIIKTEYPSKFNIERPLWDRKSVAELFEKKFKVKYSLHKISKILRDRGLVLRRPAKFSVKRDQGKVDHFRDEIYQDIKKEVEEDGGTIAFIDETLVKQNSNTLRGFSPIGVAPRLQHYTETLSYGIGYLIIGFTLIGFMLYHFIESTCNASDIVWYLEQFLKKIPGKIHIILDNARVHKCKKVDEFLKIHKRLKLHYLHPYAPDINPVELFNNALKSNIKHQKAMNQEELKDFVLNFIDGKSKDEDYIKSFFEGKEMRYTKSA